MTALDCEAKALAQRTAAACVYCAHATSSTHVPVDQAGWDKAALEHAADCEWIATMAHTKFPDQKAVR